VLIASDAARAALVALMAIPGTPLPVLLALLFVVAVCAPPFESARSALMADVMDGDTYAVATSLTNISLQLAQVIGFVLAGALVALLDPSAALLINAATFAVSALWLAGALKRRPAPVTAGGGRSGGVLRDAGDAFRLIRRSPRLMAIIGVLWIGTLFAYASEGIATPLVEELGQGTAAVGLLLAANPLGVTVGGLVVARLVPPHRRDALVPYLVALSLLPLVAAGLIAAVAGPGAVPFAAFLALLFVSGLGGAWLIPLNVSFVQAVPQAFRGRAFGVAVAGLYGVQGVGVLAAGLVAEGLPPSLVVAASGAVGLLAVAVPLAVYRRTQGHVAPAGVTAGSSGA
jgi:MFS family permease